MTTDAVWFAERIEDVRYWVPLTKENLEFGDKSDVLRYVTEWAESKEPVE